MSEFVVNLDQIKVCEPKLETKLVPHLQAMSALTLNQPIKFSIVSILSSSLLDKDQVWDFDAILDESAINFSCHG